MTNVRDDIKEAKEIILNKEYNSFSTLYPFTTENLNGYMPFFDFKGKRVLTVGSSADQIINSFLLGSNDIVCFDTNPFVKYYFDLKKSGIKEFSLEEFINFFCLFKTSKYVKNKNVFNLRDFERLIPYLSKESLEFWSELFSYFNSYKVRTKFFCNDEYTSSVIKSINSYMNIDNFNLLKRCIDNLNVSFIHSNIKYVSDLLSGKFDFIMLSNIASYIDSIYYNNLRGFRNNVLELSNFLNEDGIIFLSYLYDFDNNKNSKLYWDLIYQIDKVYNEFKGYDISIRNFIGISNIENKRNSVNDSILIFKK